MMKTVAPKLGVCLGVVLLVLLMDSSMCYGQPTQMDDVLYLKNGSIIRGTVIEQVPGKSLKIMTKDGNVLVNALDEVVRFTKRPARHRASNIRKVGRKSGETAFFLSLLIPGGGQFYNGEPKKGAAMLGLSIIGVGFWVARSASSSGYFNRHDATVGLLLWLGSALWSMIDAPISSARINREDDWASNHRVSDNLYVDFRVSNIESRSTPYIRVVLSF
jgi:hypothetical protein